MWQAQSFCCLYEDCLRISLFVVSFPLNWSESCRLHGLPSKHRCEEPLVWTVIPLLKPWAEPYSDTPDAINDSTCATMCSRTPEQRRCRMCSFVSVTSPRHPAKVLQKFSDGVSASSGPSWTRRGEASPATLESGQSLHMHLTWNSTPRNSTRSGFCQSLFRGRGGGSDRGRCKVVFCCCWPGSTEGDSLSAECLSQPHET